MEKVTIEVKKDPRYRVKTQFIKETAQGILAGFGLTNKIQLGVVITGSRKAKQLNQTYRKMDYIPEVLSFSYNEEMPKGEFFLGEVVICFPLAREKAIRENQEIEEAISDLLRHGIGNLLKSR